MVKQLLSSMMVAGVLAGCGAPQVATVAYPTTVARLQAVSTGITLTDARQVVDHAAVPIRMSFTLTGTRNGQPFRLVLKTLDQHNFYVPTADSVTVNGQTIPKANWKALEEELYVAKGNQGNNFQAVEVSNIMRISQPRSVQDAAN